MRFEDTFPNVQTLFFISQSGCFPKVRDMDNLRIRSYYQLSRHL